MILSYQSGCHNAHEDYQKALKVTDLTCEKGSFDLQALLTDKEVSLITSVLQAANGLHVSRTGGHQSFSHSFQGGFQGDDLQDMVGRLTARALAGLEDVDYDRHFRDMINRLEYAFFPEQNVEEQMNGMMDRYNVPRIGGEEPEGLKVKFHYQAESWTQEVLNGKIHASGAIPLSLLSCQISQNKSSFLRRPLLFCTYVFQMIHMQAPACSCVEHEPSNLNAERSTAANILTSF